MQTYLFYDLETSGLDRVFDQPLQFAALRTDKTFNLIDETSIKIRLRTDIVPSPRAFLTHRIPLANSDKAMNEYEAMKLIHRLVNTPGTVSLGYNTLGFDDEFLRFGFHRNLLPPYTHQYLNGCRRMDIFPITIAFSLFKPEALRWPVRENGKVSLKLEDLNAINQFATGPAHDALVDVKATLALTKRLANFSDMWDYLSAYFDKEMDHERILNLSPSIQSVFGTHAYAIMLTAGYGGKNGYLVPVLSIGDSVPYKNQTLWLILNDATLRETTLTTIPKATQVIRKKMGEPGFLLPPLDRFVDHLDPAIRQTVQQNLQWLQEQQVILREIIHYHQHYRYPEIPNLDVDAALYEIGFPDREETEQMQRFHAAGIKKKGELIDHFQRPEYRKLAKRVLFRNYPGFFTGDFTKERLSLKQKINPARKEEAMLDYAGRERLTPREALAEIKKFKSSLAITSEDLNLLEELERYLNDQFNAEQQLAIF